MQIIVIEDQPAIRGLLAELLAHEGYQVITCADRHSAVEAIESAQCGDVVALDWIVPDVDGDELLMAVMRHPANLHCVILSGYPVEIGHYPRQWHSRIACLDKPFTPVMLIDRIVSLLTSERTEQAKSHSYNR